MSVFFFFEVKNNILGSHLQSKFIWSTFCAVLVFFFLTILILLSFESNSMEMVINVHHPHSVLSPKQNTNKVNECQKSIQTKYILKNVRGKENFVLFSAQANRGTPQMLRFSKTVKEKHLEMRKNKSFYHIEVAVLCPVQKNWLIFKS